MDWLVFIFNYVIGITDKMSHDVKRDPKKGNGVAMS